MSKNLYYSNLLDFYGELLKDKQRETMEYYYNDDLSLSEIAEIFSISKQGVRDLIKRSEVQLENIEKKLQLINKFGNTKEKLNAILEITKKIEDKIKHESDIKKLDHMLENIKEIVTSLYKEI